MHTVIMRYRLGRDASRVAHDFDAIFATSLAAPCMLRKSRVFSTSGAAAPARDAWHRAAGEHAGEPSTGEHDQWHPAPCRS